MINYNLSGIVTALKLLQKQHQEYKDRVDLITGELLQGTTYDKILENPNIAVRAQERDELFSALDYALGVLAPITENIVTVRIGQFRIRLEKGMSVFDISNELLSLRETIEYELTKINLHRYHPVRLIFFFISRVNGRVYLKNFPTLPCLYELPSIVTRSGIIEPPYSI